MPSYNFKKQLAPLVESRRKRQTIRAKRKNRPRPGQTAYCFEGLRTKACRRLGAWEIRKVKDVSIKDVGCFVDGQRIQGIKREFFARLDGFTCWDEMHRFFDCEHGLPFSGDLIMW